MRALIKAMLLAIACCYGLADAASLNLLPSELAPAGQGAPLPPKLAATGRKQARRPYRILDAEHVLNLIGARVENQDGQAKGNLEDFILDLRSGQLVFAVIASGGFLGLHKQFRILPPELLSSATAKRGVVELQVGNVRWQRAPRFRYAGLASLENSDLQRRIYHYYNQILAVAGPASYPITNALVSLVGGGANKRTNKPSLQLATWFIGKPVLNPQKKQVGTVSDLLVDLKGKKPVLAVISPSGSLSGDMTFAVLVPRLRAQAATSFILDAPRRLFAQAPGRAKGRAL